LRRFLDLETRIVFELLQIVGRRKQDVRKFDDRKLVKADCVVIPCLHQSGAWHCDRHFLLILKLPDPFDGFSVGVPIASTQAG